MKLEEKVEALNKAVSGTLSIIHYSAWEVSSYKDGSLFSAAFGNAVVAESFVEAVEKAYEKL